MLQICENIKLARDSAGFSQVEMAAFLGVPRTTYANWENNTEPTITIIKELAKILKVNFYDLIDVEKSEKITGNVLANLSEAIVEQAKAISSQQYVIKRYIEKDADTSDPPKNVTSPKNSMKLK